VKLFHYPAVSRSGDRLAGEMEAHDRQNVLDELHASGHFPVDVREATGKVFDATRRSLALSASRPSSSQITLFTHELAMLLKAGLPLDRCLDLLAKDASSRNLSKLISRVNAEINDGKSLHEALAAQNGVFPSVYVNMVRVAEASGTLVAVLERVAQARRRAEKLRGKALSAALYPALLIIIAVTAVIIMLTVVVPRFKQMILQAGTEVPDSARIVIGASDWLITNGQTLLFSIGGVVVLLFVLWQQGQVRLWIETLLFRLPLIGQIMRLNLTIRFCGTLGVLLENGVELPAAIKLVRDVIGNQKAIEALDEAYGSLRKGRSFLDPLTASGLFPPVVINMLRVGEETGGLAPSLKHMTDMFEDKLETTVQRTFTIFEPVIILLVSVFIAAIIMSILGAVISVNDLAI
jgi:general secretion pathway protein F